MKSSDESLVSDASKVIIKKLAKSRDKGFMRAAVPVIMKGNAAKESKAYQFVWSKLGL